MPSSPPGTLERLAGILIPPARREDVLGDLHERYVNPAQYIVDVLRTAPFVIVSSARRASEPQLVLMEALLFHASFLSAAWYMDKAFLNEPRGLARLAVHSAIALAITMLCDAWELARRRSPFRRATAGVAFGLVVAGLCGVAALSRAAALLGTFLSLLLVSAVRTLFLPASDLPPGAGAPATIHKEGKSMNTNTKRIVFFIVLCFAAIALATVIGQSWAQPKATYSAFLRHVQAGEVRSATVAVSERSGTDRIAYTLKNGSRMETIVPSDDREALAALRDRHVDIDIRDAWPWYRILGKASPFLLLMGVWIFAMHQLRKTPRGPGQPSLKLW